MLRQHRGKQAEILRVDAIEMEREALLVADVDTRDRPIAVGRQDPLYLGIDDQPPGKGDVVRRQRLAVRPAQSRAEPVRHVHRAGSTIPFDVAVFEGRHAFHQIGYRPSKTDRKSTRLNSSHVSISYAVFCLKKKKKKKR